MSADLSPALSMQLSADFRFALDALKYVDAALDAISGDRFEREQRLTAAMGLDTEKWRYTDEGKACRWVCEQEQAFVDLRCALEAFMRVRDCVTIGDLVEKIRIDAFWLTDPANEILENTPEDCVATLRSMLPWFDKVEAPQATA